MDEEATSVPTDEGALDEASAPGEDALEPTLEVSKSADDATEPTDDASASDTGSPLRAIPPRFSISRYLIDRWLAGEF